MECRPEVRILNNYLVVSPTDLKGTSHEPRRMWLESQDEGDVGSTPTLATIAGRVVF